MRENESNPSWRTGSKSARGAEARGGAVWSGWVYDTKKMFFGAMIPRV